MATVAVLCWLGAAVPSALADRSFTPRFSADVTGNITFAANTLMVCPASAAGCTAARNTRPIGSGSNAALDNNGYDMQYVNATPGTIPALGAACPGSGSFDSSSATLSLPSTATVLFAGLYWGVIRAGVRVHPTSVRPPPGLGAASASRPRAHRATRRD